MTIKEFTNEMKKKGFSGVGEIKKLNFYFKTWDGVQVDELESYDKELYIQFLIDNSIKMTQLEEVDFWGFPSDKLEPFLSGIRSLKKIKNTQGKYSFPKSILLNENLEELSLTLTPIKKIPQGIGELDNLRKLDLAQTDVQLLPEEIGKLVELRELIVHTKLINLHNTIASNVNLKTLDLGSNKLTVLPEGIFELKSLESLELSGNPIENIDFHLAKWPKLKKLDVSRTPFGIYRKNIELLMKIFPEAEIIGGSNNQFVGDSKSGIYLHCTKTTYK